MTEAFDPYRKWLGIPPSQQPPHHYRLLGIELFETDVEVIDTAAGQRMSYLQELAGGAYVKESQRLLNEVSAARRCLLDAKRKGEYDAELKAKIAASQPPVPPAAKAPAAPPRTTTVMPKAKPIVDEDDATITLKFSDATAKLGSRSSTASNGSSSKSKHAGAKTELAHSETPASPRRKKSRSPLPLLFGVIVILAGVAAYVVLNQKSNVETAVTPLTPPPVYPPSTENYDHLTGDAIPALPVARPGKPLGGAVTAAAAPSATPSGTSPPFDSAFFTTPAKPKPTTTPTATPTATTRTKAPVPAPPSSTEVAESIKLFTPAAGLPLVPGAKPKVTPTGTKATPSATAAPKATASATGKP